MNKKTLNALNKSIAHWQRLAARKRQRGEYIGIEHCNLCRLFWLGDCKLCPVKLRTGQQGCQGTPYDEAQSAENYYGLDSPEFKRAAKKELTFLKSLLPKSTKKGQNK